MLFTKPREHELQTDEARPPCSAGRIHNSLVPCILDSCQLCSDPWIPIWGPSAGLALPSNGLKHTIKSPNNCRDFDLPVNPGAQHTALLLPWRCCWCLHKISEANKEHLSVKFIQSSVTSRKQFGHLSVCEIFVQTVCVAQMCCVIRKLLKPLVFCWGDDVEIIQILCNSKKNTSI